MATIHGMYGTPTYRSWASMKQRCNNPNNDRYESYGGRGIKHIKKWRLFEGFLEDMGERPNGKSLDRINNDKGYMKANCKWSTPIEQSNNTRYNKLINWKGKIQSISEWERELGLISGVLYSRLNRGWALERAMIAESITEENLTYKGKTLSISAWAKYLGITRGALYCRIHRKLPEHKIFSKPMKKGVIMITIDGVTKTAGTWRKELNVPKGTFHNRLKRGWTKLEALLGKDAGGCG